jgi:hypothetical protein
MAVGGRCNEAARWSRHDGPLAEAHHGGPLAAHVSPCALAFDHCLDARQSLGDALCTVRFSYSGQR